MKTILSGLAMMVLAAGLAAPATHAGSVEAPGPRIIAVSPDATVSADGCTASMLLSDFSLSNSGTETRSWRLQLSEGAGGPWVIRTHLRGFAANGSGRMVVAAGGSRFSRNVNGRRTGADYFLSGSIRQSRVPAEIELNVTAVFRANRQDANLQLDSVDVSVCG